MTDIHCGRCGMTFEVKKPPTYQTERCRCPEDGCGRPFWTGSTVKSAQCATVGVDPKDADWKPFLRLRGTLHPRYSSSAKATEDRGS